MTGPTGDTTSIVVYVCTYRRNEPLARVLASLERAASAVRPRADVGVVVVDDNPDGSARSVVEASTLSFPLGLHYRHAGSQNISMARNLGLEAAAAMAEWVAMTDDDVVVPDDWFDAHLDLAARTGAGATTGPLLLTFPDHAPSWIHDEPFDRFGLLEYDDDAEVPICATGNSMVRSSFLTEHPEIRFDPDLGVVGGEDMVFYRAAVGAGLRCYFSTATAVRELEPDERSTLRYQLGRALWMGNTIFLTNHRSGDASRLRLLLRGGKVMAGALVRPVRQMAGGRRPQFRFGAALFAQGLGTVLGVAGVVLDHHQVD